MKNKLSFYVVVLIILSTLFTNYTSSKKNKICWDWAGYYFYLPNLFIYNDPAPIDLNTMNNLVQKYEISSTLYQYTLTQKNTHIVRYTSGTAVLLSPFFFIGHFSAKILGYEQDGFSLPYQLAIWWGVFIYGCIAIILLRKLLIFFFDDIPVAITLLVLFIGTNLFYYFHYNTFQIHYILFFLYAVFINYSIQFHKSKSVKNILGLAISGGLIILTRPTDFMIALFPILYNFNFTINSFKRLLRESKYYLIIGLIAFLIFSIQIIYWKLHVGKFFTNSYGNPQEGLDIFSPYILEFLFSFRKGWLIYTPIGIFMIFGFYTLYKIKKELFYSSIFYFIAFLWIVSSWTCWWYAGSFGSRAMLQSYVVLSIPLATFIQQVLKQKIYIKSMFFIVLILFGGLNLFQTYQLKKSILSNSNETKKHYFEVFGDIRRNPDLDRFLLRETPRVLDSLDVRLEFKKVKTLDLSENDMDSLYNNDFFTFIKIPAIELSSKYRYLVRLKGLYKCECNESSKILIAKTMLYNDKTYFYTAQELLCPTDSFANFNADYIIPDLRRKTDVYHPHVYNIDKVKFQFTNLKLEVWEYKEYPELE